jgi:hypothetical protein
LQNAILCSEDLFAACGARKGASPAVTMAAAEVEVLSGALLDCRASNAPKAIRLAALSALTQATSAESGEQLLGFLAPSLASKSGHLNRDVAEQARVLTLFLSMILMTLPSDRFLRLNTSRRW